MKTLRKAIICVLLLLCLCTLVFPVAASTYMEYEGLEVSIVMDKEHYDYGEPITATITVTNTNSRPVNIVNLEQLIPEGYVLSENSTAAKSNFQINAGETVVLEVTMEGAPVQLEEEEAEATSFFDKLLYGETMGVSNLLLAVLALIAFGVFMLLT